MSRIEDERDAARLLEKTMLQKREKEQRELQKQGAESAFSKKVAQNLQQKETAQKESLGKNAIASLIEAPKQKLKKDETTLQSARSLAAFQAGKEEASSRAETAEGQSHTEAVHAADGHEASTAAEGRKSDAKVSRELLEKREEKSDAAVTSAGFSEAKEAGSSGEGSTGNSGGQGGKKDDKAAELPAGFRFNPALMAPVPLAKPRDMAGSERLRALATEIAQKIVESARVGTNAAGKAEFQIDLRSNVLSGLSIKVSGSNGKIRAVFSGNDREVLKLLKEQGEQLKNALSGRGLTLEEFRVEERA